MGAFSQIVPHIPLALGWRALTGMDAPCEARVNIQGDEYAQKCLWEFPRKSLPRLSCGEVKVTPS